MATYTENYQLTKPTMAEIADIRTINNNMDSIDDIMHASQVSIADAYSHLLTYEVGDYVMYEKLLYECITAIATPEPWDPTKWQRAVAANAKPPVMTGATESEDGESGLVPAPLSTEKDKFLKGDGTWGTPSGGGSGNVDDVYENGISVLGQDHIARTKSYKVLTQAEYDALPASKLTDGIMYCISDSGPVEGDKFAPVIYSLEEREVGTWIDGKPLYQKTFEGTLVSPDPQSIDLSSLNISDLVKWEVEVKGLSGGIQQIIYNVGNADSDRIAIDFYNNNFRIFSTSYYVSRGYTYTATLFYTKTTDTPGSGSWASNGVPAHHYSTDEQIVGTWIDGRTVYEKSFDANFENGATSLSIPFTGCDISSLLDLKGVLDTHVLFDIHGMVNGTSSGDFNIVSNHQYAQYGYFGDAGITCRRLNGTIYGNAPNVKITIRYTKTQGGA
jgi:hypothetical protein